MSVRVLILLLVTCFSSAALAHKSSDSYLKVKATDSRAAIQWDIGLRDLDHLLKLDADANGKITWGEVRGRLNEITTVTLNTLKIKNNEQNCTYSNISHLIDYHSGYAYLVLKAEAQCTKKINKIAIKYDFLFDQNAQHRGLLGLSLGDKETSYVFSPDNRTAVLSLSIPEHSGFLTFFFKGIEHLIGGIDHLLFLFVLLLPAVMVSNYGNKKNTLQTIFEVGKILTAFTVAHAITLTLSVLKVVSIPVTPVEIIIALSVAVTAIDNIKPVFGKFRWAIAGGFGLIHGLGFANALGPLNLSSEALFTALLAFNLGLEFAQIMIACILIPAGYILFSQKDYYSRVGTSFGSAMAIMIALLWTIDRSFGLEMMPF